MRAILTPLNQESGESDDEFRDRIYDALREEGMRDVAPEPIPPEVLAMFPPPG